MFSAFFRQTGKLLRTSSFRQALMYMVLFNSSVLVLLSFIYWSTAGYMSRQTDATIQAEIKGLGEQYRRNGAKGLASIIQERVARNPDGSSIYLLAGPNQQRIAGNLNTIPVTEAFDEDGWLNFKLQKKDGDQHSARSRVFQLPNRLLLLVGRDIQELEEIQQLILRALAWGMAITLGMALAGGLVFSRGMARRIEAINQTSREIMEGDLSRRIPTRGIGDDFDQLAENLNKMLSQIERLMEGVRQVSNNVAHDLKTPLTHLRNRLEEMRRHPPGSEGYEELVEQNINEADRLLSMFNALLRISRIESGSRIAEHSSVDLETLVTDVAELYEAVAHEKDQHFTLHVMPGLTVPGDRDLLFQAVANMLDNAVKYTPAEGHIGVSLMQLPEGAPAVIVQDTGPGIPSESRDKVLERFFRMETSRSTPGNGLGLSLVLAVATMHNAELRLEDNAPGLRLVMAFTG